MRKKLKYRMVCRTTTANRLGIKYEILTSQKQAMIFVKKKYLTKRRTSFCWKNVL